MAAKVAKVFVGKDEAFTELSNQANKVFFCLGWKLKMPE
jgi:hypothetical protein